MPISFIPTYSLRCLFLLPLPLLSYSAHFFHPHLLPSVPYLVHVFPPIIHSHQTVPYSFTIPSNQTVPDFFHPHPTAISTLFLSYTHQTSSPSNYNICAYVSLQACVHSYMVSCIYYLSPASPPSRGYK